MAQRDPEFYAYLKETDEDLLAFGVGEADESEDEEGAAEELEVGIHAKGTPCGADHTLTTNCLSMQVRFVPVDWTAMSPAHRMKPGMMVQRRPSLGCKLRPVQQVGISAIPCAR